MKGFEYNFVGKNSEQPEVKEAAMEILDQRSKEAKEKKIPNEVPKTETEMQEIKEIENSVNRELKDLGLEPDYQINPDDVHIVLVKRTNPFHFRGGSHNPMEPGIVLNRENGKTLYVRLMHKIISKFEPIITGDELKDLQVPILTHESIHNKSYHSHRISKEKDGSLGVSAYRLGYHIMSDKPEDIWFAGFNEAVTDKTMLDIMNKDKKEGEEKMVSKSRYKFNLDLVDKIVEKIAIAKGETKDDVWKRFKVGQFTGNMMHLRDIEKVFGKDSLRVLAAMPAVLQKEWRKTFETYFTTNDEEEKREIAKMILG